MMSRPFSARLMVSILDFVDGGWRKHIKGKGRLEQHVALTPVDERLEVQLRAIVAKRNALDKSAGEDAAAYF